MADYKYTPADFKSDQMVKWCPGCGDHAILNAVQRAMPVFYYKKLMPKCQVSVPLQPCRAAGICCLQTGRAKSRCLSIFSWRILNGAYAISSEAGLSKHTRLQLVTDTNYTASDNSDETDEADDKTAIANITETQ